MRIALSLALVTALSTSAYADVSELKDATADDGSKAKPILGGGAQFGLINNKLTNDSASRGPGVYKGFVYGGTFFVRYPLFRTRYHTNIGVWGTGDMLGFTPGAVMRSEDSLDTAPDVPPLLYFHLGGAAGLALDIVHSPRMLATMDLGAHASSDFYGVNGELGVRFAPRKPESHPEKSFAVVIAYRVRSGFTWDLYHMLDERLRIGFGIMKGMFVGIEHLHGYAEDEMQRGDLNSMFKGAYTMASLVFATNTGGEQY